MALGPTSLSARYWGDARVLAVASRALVLQVAHPVVGAGVSEHSDFAADPWGRLVRTLDTVAPLIYGTDERRRDLGEGLRRGHRGIVGTDSKGRRYTALDPEAYFWVHATLFDTVRTTWKVFGPGVPERHLGQLYDEFVEAGESLQVDARQVPPGLAAFDAWFAAMIDDRLERTEAIDEVERVLRLPVPPPALPRAARDVWPVAWAPLGYVAGVNHRTLLPRALRRRWGIEVSRADRAQLRALASAVRVAFAALPAARRELPQVRRERRTTARAGAHTPLPSLAD